LQRLHHIYINGVLWTFPLPPGPTGFVVLCQLAQEPCMRFLFVGSHVCHRASFRPLLARRRPCLWLVILVVFISMNTIGSRTGDFHPTSSRPCRAYTNRPTGSPINPAPGELYIGWLHLIFKTTVIKRLYFLIQGGRL
jgi:hypothetical protein